MNEQAKALLRTTIGRVVGKKMNQTALVLVEAKVRHAKYGKYIKRRKKFVVHDETNQSKEGDIVMICECRPISKTKNWKLLEIVERAESTKA